MTGSFVWNRPISLARMRGGSRCGAGRKRAAATTCGRPRDKLTFSFVSLMLFLDAGPIIGPLAGLLLRDPVPLLQPADKLIACSRDLIEVVVGEFSPLLFRRAFELLPFSFNLIPIHCVDSL